MNSEVNGQTGNQPDIPENLKPLVEKLQTFQPDTFLSQFKNPRVRQVMYEILSSVGGVPMAPEDKRPEWALNAWRKAFKALGLLAVMTAGPSSADQEANHFGFIIGLFSAFGPEPLTASADMQKLNSMLADLIPMLRALAAESSPSEAAAFFSAQYEGTQKKAEIEQASQRTKILLFMAVLWEVVVEFKSTGELFQRLRSLKSDDGRYFIAQSTESREIRAICKLIGLRYESRGGRPRKKN
jgi:hypothetical protein